MSKSSILTDEHRFPFSLFSELKHSGNTGLKQSGDVTEKMEKSIGRLVYRIRGAVSAKNYLEFENLKLTGHLIYLQYSLIQSSVATCHFEVQTSGGFILRFSMSTLYDGDQPRFLGRSLRLPLPSKPGWIVLEIDFKALVAQYCQPTGSTVQMVVEFGSIKNIQLCSNMVVRDVVTSDSPISSDPKHLPKELAVRPNLVTGKDELQWFKLFEYCKVMPRLPSPDNHLSFRMSNLRSGKDLRSLLEDSPSVSVSEKTTFSASAKQLLRKGSSAKNMSPAAEEQTTPGSIVSKSTVSKSPSPGKAAARVSRKGSTRMVKRTSSKKEAKTDSKENSPQPTNTVGTASEGSDAESVLPVEVEEDLLSTMLKQESALGQLSVGSVHEFDDNDILEGESLTVGVAISSEPILEELDTVSPLGAPQRNQSQRRNVIPDSPAQAVAPDIAGGWTQKSSPSPKRKPSPEMKPTVVSRALSSPRNTLVQVPPAGTPVTPTAATVKYTAPPEVAASQKVLQMERALGYTGGPAVLLYEGRMLLLASGPMLIMIDLFRYPPVLDPTAESNIPNYGLWRAFRPTPAKDSGYKQSFLRGHTAPVGIIELSEKEKYMATGESTVRKGAVVLWDLQEGRRLATLRPHAESLKAVSFSCGGSGGAASSGALLATAGTDAYHRFQIVVWDVQMLILEKAMVEGSDQVLQTAGLVVARQISEFPVTCLRFSPFEEFGLVSCGRENVRFWRIRKGHLPGRPVLLNEYARDFDFLDIGFQGEGAVVPGKDGQAAEASAQFVYVASSKGILLRINSRNDQVICAFKLHETAITSLNIHSSSGYAVTAGAAVSPNLGKTAGPDAQRSRQLLRVWPLDFSDFLLEAQHEGPVTNARIALSDGRKLVVGTSAGTLGILNVSEHSYNTVLRSHVGSVVQATSRGNSLAASANVGVSEFATIGADCTIRVWDALTATQTLEFSSAQDAPTAVCCHPSKALLACGFASGAVRLFDTQTAVALHEALTTHRAPVAQLRVLERPEQDSLLVSLGQDGMLVVLQVTTEGFSLVRNLRIGEGSSNNTQKQKWFLEMSDDCSLLVAAADIVSSIIVVETKEFTCCLRFSPSIGADSPQTPVAGQKGDSQGPDDFSFGRGSSAERGSNLNAPLVGVSLVSDRPGGAVLLATDRHVVSVPVLMNQTEEAGSSRWLLSRRLNSWDARCVRRIEFGIPNYMVRDPHTGLLFFGIRAPLASNNARRSMAEPGRAASPGPVTVASRNAPSSVGESPWRQQMTSLSTPMAYSSPMHPSPTGKSVVPTSQFPQQHRSAPGARSKLSDTATAMAVVEARHRVVGGRDRLSLGTPQLFRDLPAPVLTICPISPCRKVVLVDEDGRILLWQMRNQNITRIRVDMSKLSPGEAGATAPKSNEETTEDKIAAPTQTVIKQQQSNIPTSVSTPTDLKSFEKAVSADPALWSADSTEKGNDGSDAESKTGPEAKVAMHLDYSSAMDKAEQALSKLASATNVLRKSKSFREASPEDPLPLETTSTESKKGSMADSDYDLMFQSAEPSPVPKNPLVFQAEEPPKPISKSSSSSLAPRPPVKGHEKAELEGLLPKADTHSAEPRIRAPTKAMLAKMRTATSTERSSQEKNWAHESAETQGLAVPGSPIEDVLVRMRLWQEYTGESMRFGATQTNIVKSVMSEHAEQEKGLVVEEHMRSSYESVRHKEPSSLDLLLEGADHQVSSSEGKYGTVPANVVLKSNVFPTPEELIAPEEDGFVCRYPEDQSNVRAITHSQAVQPSFCLTSKLLFSSDGSMIYIKSLSSSTATEISLGFPGPLLNSETNENKSKCKVVGVKVAPCGAFLAAVVRVASPGNTHCLVVWHNKAAPGHHDRSVPVNATGDWQCVCCVDTGVGAAGVSAQGRGAPVLLSWTSKSSLVLVYPREVLLKTPTGRKETAWFLKLSVVCAAVLKDGREMQRKWDRCSYLLSNPFPLPRDATRDSPLAMLDHLAGTLRDLETLPHAINSRSSQQNVQVLLLGLPRTVLVSLPGAASSSPETMENPSDFAAITLWTDDIGARGPYLSFSSTPAGGFPLESTNREGKVAVAKEGQGLAAAGLDSCGAVNIFWITAAEATKKEPEGPQLHLKPSVSKTLATPVLVRTATTCIPAANVSGSPSTILLTPTNSRHHQHQFSLTIGFNTSVRVFALSLRGCGSRAIGASLALQFKVSLDFPPEFLLSMPLLMSPGNTGHSVGSKSAPNILLGSWLGHMGFVSMASILSGRCITSKQCLVLRHPPTYVAAASTITSCAAVLPNKGAAAEPQYLVLSITSKGNVAVVHRDTGIRLPFKGLENLFFATTLMKGISSGYFVVGGRNGQVAVFSAKTLRLMESLSLSPEGIESAGAHPRDEEVLQHPKRKAQPGLSSSFERTKAKVESKDIHAVRKLLSIGGSATHVLSIQGNEEPTTVYIPPEDAFTGLTPEKLSPPTFARPRPDQDSPWRNEHQVHTVPVDCHYGGSDMINFERRPLGLFGVVRAGSNLLELHRVDVGGGARNVMNVALSAPVNVKMKRDDMSSAYFPATDADAALRTSNDSLIHVVQAHVVIHDGGLQVFALGTFTPEADSASKQTETDAPLSSTLFLFGGAMSLPVAPSVLSGLGASETLAQLASKPYRLSLNERMIVVQTSDGTPVKIPKSDVCTFFEHFCLVRTAAALYILDMPHMLRALPLLKHNQVRTETLLRRVALSVIPARAAMIGASASWEGCAVELKEDLGSKELGDNVDSKGKIIRKQKRLDLVVFRKHKSAVLRYIIKIA